MKVKWPRFRIPDRLKDAFLLTARLMSGALFFYSGFSKLIQPAEYFEVAIGQYALGSPDIAHYAALAVPWIEILSGTFLFLGYLLEASAGVLAVLTGLFQLVLGQALVRRLPMDECGCFGGGFIHLTLYQSFVLDTILVLCLIQIATADRQLLSLDRLLLPGEK